MKLKNYILGMMAAVGLLTTSCSEELFNENSSGETQKVTFSLGLEGQMQMRGDNISQNDYESTTTRISDGTRATHLIYELYEQTENELKPVKINATGAHLNRKEITDAKFPQNINLILVKGKQYRIVFWAQTPNNPYYETDDLSNIGIRYDAMNENNNDELRDVFCIKYDFKADPQQTDHTITLTRPLAQINVGTTKKDWDVVLKNYPFDLSKIKINYAGNRFNLIENKAIATTEGMTVADYQYAKIPQMMEKIEEKTVNEDDRYLSVKIKQDDSGQFVDSETAEKYHWISMCYVLVPSEDNDKSSTIDITELKFTKDGADYELEPFVGGLKNVPVQRNYRTNIIGNILTEYQTFTIQLDKNFAGDFNFYDEQWYGEIADGVSYSEKTGGSRYGERFRSGLNFYVSSAKGLQWLADRSNKEPLEEKDIPACFTTSGSDRLAAYKKFVFDIINNRTFMDQGVDETRFNNNAPWTYDECTIYLTKDIDWTAEMGTVSFRPFSMKHGTTGGTAVYHTGTFKGEFDGQYHTISNLIINTHNNNPASNGAFIATATDSPILKNLRLYAADIKANWNVGGFVGRYDSTSGMITMENCLLENSKIHAEVGNSPSEDANIGGLIGVVVGNKTNVIKNCHVRNTRLESAYVAGGLFGLCIKNTIVENCSISDVAIIINEMSAVGDKMQRPVDNILIDDYWLCGTSKDNITATNVQHNNVVRSVFYGTRERSADKEKDGIGEIDRLPLHWFPMLYGEWANGIKLISHITGTTSYNPIDQNWCAGLYIDTQHTGYNNVKNNTADYTLCGDVREDKPLYAINVQNPDAKKTCYGVYMTGDNTATIKDIVINGDPSITAGIYLDKAKDVVLNNVAVYDVENTIDDDDTNVPQNAKLSVTDCDLRGNTQYGSGYSSVTFTNTIFSKGSGTTENMNKKSVIPGSATTFNGCSFRSGFKVDLSKLSDGIVIFKNCKIGDAGKEIDLTSDNIEELVGEADSGKYTIGS